MSLTIASAVLFAALMHACWNAILRGTQDRLAVLAMLTGVGGIIGLVGIFFVDIPPAQAWPWLLASVALHLGYNSFLGIAYKYGELGKVYPLARGTAPMLTMLGGFTIVGETLPIAAIAGILLVGLGILSLALERGWRTLIHEPKGVVFALITSLFISGYTMTDGIGARTAGDPHAYTLWLFALDGLPLTLFVLATHGRETVGVIKRNWLQGSVAGLLSMVAYWIVIWAMTKAPIALVAALRETSVLFALVLGMVFLGERFSAIRLLSILIVLTGLVMLRI